MIGDLAYDMLLEGLPCFDIDRLIRISSCQAGLELPIKNSDGNSSDSLHAKLWREVHHKGALGRISQHHETTANGDSHD